MKNPAKIGHHDFYGTTTIGDKGQVVIPADARKALNLNTGDKLLVFGLGKNLVALAKIEHLEKMANSLSQRLKGLQQILKKV